MNPDDVVSLGPLVLALDRVVALGLFAVFLWAIDWIVRRHGAGRASLGWWALAAGLIAARLDYVAVHRASFALEPLEALRVWLGGWTWFTGVIAALAVLGGRLGRTRAMAEMEARETEVMEPIVQGAERELSGPMARQAVLDVLAEHGVTGHRIRTAPGIYVRLDDPFAHAVLAPPAPGADPFRGLGKIAALGIKVSRNCTYHGLALNVAMDWANAINDAEQHDLLEAKYEELLLKIPELTPNYLIEVVREGNLDQMLVNVELSIADAGIEDGLRKDVAGNLQHLIKTYVGISVRVLLQQPEALERSVGKAKRVVDKRPKEAAPVA